MIDLNPAAIASVGAAAGVEALVGDSLELLPLMLPNLPNDTVMYCDPPYLLSTRKGRRYYEHELSESDHSTLLAELLQAKCRVLISGYPSDLYSWTLHGWRCLEYLTMTRGGIRREYLWCNFPEPSELHDWRFSGLDFRQRFNLKRFVRRWLARIDLMPSRRRGYVLSELEAAIAKRQGRSCGPEAK